jgi:hypothetical protein
MGAAGVDSDAAPAVGSGGGPPASVASADVGLDGDVFQNCQVLPEQPAVTTTMAREAKVETANLVARRIVGVLLSCRRLWRLQPESARAVARTRWAWRAGSTRGARALIL